MRALINFLLHRISDCVEFSVLIFFTFCIQLDLRNINGKTNYLQKLHRKYEYIIVDFKNFGCQNNIFNPC